MDSWLLRFASSWHWLVVLLIIFTFVSHIVFLRIIKIGKRGRRNLEYAALIFATFGVVTLSADVRVWLVPHFIGNEEVLAKTRLEDIKREVRMALSFNGICRKFIHTEFSPPNADEIQLEYDLACKWYAEVAKILPENIEPEFPVLHTDNLPKLVVNDEIIRQFIKRLYELFQEYEKQRAIVNELRQSQYRGDLAEIIFLLSPIFLCIALALGFTIVTAEGKERT